MKILALNCGSSSIKFVLYDWKSKISLVKGLIERIGEKDSVIKYESGAGVEKKETTAVKDHLQGVQSIISIITNPENNLISSINDISAIAHRVVHGADKFASSVIIDDNVLQVIKDVASLAPLHNPPNIVGIEAAKATLSTIPHIAVFDTAFHQTIPDYAYIYPLPYEWYTKYKVRRYGFHGTSHLYVSKRAAVILGKHPSETNVITMHIGNGVSITAVKNGVSVDTSMGLTPLEGAMMGTRSGNIDPAIISYIMQKENLTEAEVEKILNKKSGILGITGKYSDRRDVVKHASEGDYLCQLAIEMETYRLKKRIGSYTAVLGRVDAVVFTAGVGENSPIIREKTCDGLDFLGMKFDKAKNNLVDMVKKEEVISMDDSKVKILVIPTNEEIVMIEDAVALIEGYYDDHLHMTYSFQKK